MDRSKVTRELAARLTTDAALRESGRAVKAIAMGVTGKDDLAELESAMDNYRRQAAAVTLDYIATLRTK